MQDFNLRTYQKNIICALRTAMINGKKRLIMCAPTGAG